MQPEQDDGGHRDRVLEALANSADLLTLRGPPGTGSVSFEQQLRQLTRAALENVPGADLVGLTMRLPPGGLTSYGQTDEDVAELDRLQVEIGEGPCLDAVTEGTIGVVEVADFAAERDRWPRFAAAAAEHGVLSVLSFAMAPRGETPGAINIYSRSARAFDDTARTIAGAFALQAGILVFGERRVTELEQAVQTRDVIGQAKGILMERHKIGSVAAFDMLVHASQSTNLKLVDIARWMSGEVERPGGGPPTASG